VVAVAKVVVSVNAVADDDRDEARRRWRGDHPDGSAVDGFAGLTTLIQVGSVQRRFVVVFGNSVRCTMLIELLALVIHLFKNTLAGQFDFAATLAGPKPCVFSE